MLVSGPYQQKRRATTSLEGFSIAKGQDIPSEGIFILPRPYYGLDVPLERGISYLSVSRVSLFMNQEYDYRMV